MRVQLLLVMPSGTVDLNEEVYTADVKIGESMSFSRKNGEEEKPQETATSKMVGAWVWLEPGWVWLEPASGPESSGVVRYPFRKLVMS